MNVVYPLTNKSTLVAFSCAENKTLRDVLSEFISKPNPSDSELIDKLSAMLQWANLAMVLQDMGFVADELNAFQDFLEYLANPIYNEYSDYNVAHQDKNEFARHVQGWLEKNGFKWAPAFVALKNRVKFNENASEQETTTENVTRSNKNEQTAQDTLTRNGTNTSTATLSSNSTAKKLSSNFPIVDYTTEGASVDDKYADGSEKTTQESTSNATNNATAEANETRNGTNSETSNGTENRTYTRKKESTNGRTPFELQKAYLDSLTNLTDEIVRSFATLLNGNMYSF